MSDGEAAMSSRITLTYRFLEDEDGEITGICDELGLASCGRDIDAAKAALEKAISLVLNGMTEKEEYGPTSKSVIFRSTPLTT